MDEEGAIGEVGAQVLDDQAADGELAVKPAGRGASEAGGRASGGRETDHFVKVFCWTMTHCCSRGAMVPSRHWKQAAGRVGAAFLGAEVLC